MPPVFVSVFMKGEFGVIGYLSEDRSRSFFGAFFTPEQGYELLRLVETDLVSVQETQEFSELIDMMTSDSLNEPLLIVGPVGHALAAAANSQEEFEEPDEFFVLRSIFVGESGMIAVFYEVEGVTEVGFAFAIDQLYILLSSPHLEENMTHLLSDPRLVRMLPMHDSARPIQRVSGVVALLVSAILSLIDEQNSRVAIESEVPFVN